MRDYYFRGQQKSWCQIQNTDFSIKAKKLPLWADFCKKELKKTDLDLCLFEIYKESIVLCGTFFGENHAAKNPIFSTGGHGMVSKCECADCGAEPSLTALKGLSKHKGLPKPRTFLNNWI